MREPAALNAEQIGEFFEEATKRRRPYRAAPAAFDDEPFWASIAEVLDILEKKHPWKVRRVRSSFRWLFRRVNYYQREGRWN